MAKVKIQGHASGTGVLTVTAPNTSSDRTITLPDATCTLADNSDVTTKLPLAGGALTGDVTLTTADTPSLKIEETGGSYIELTAGGSTGYIYSKSGHDLTFRPAGTTQLVLTSGGRGLSQFTAKVWANWSTTGTAALNDSHNVSSLDDRGTGWSRINFSNNLGNSSYAVTALAGNYKRMTSDGAGLGAGNVDFFTMTHSGTTNADEDRNFMIAFGD